VLDAEIELPSDMDGWRAEVEGESERLRAEGRTPLWNGPRYAVESFDVLRTALEEQPVVHLRLRPTDYYTFLAAQPLSRSTADWPTGQPLVPGISRRTIRCGHPRFCSAASL
jgi:hypothetical protein